MKLSKLYCNQANFKNIEFNLNGLNVIYADVKTSFNDKKNSHDLGKTKVAELIDFLLLKDVDQKKHFLFKIKENNKSIFNDYIFYLEILLNDGSFLTMRRGIENNSKISFSINEKRAEDFTPPLKYDYTDVSIEKSKKILSDYLSFDFFFNKNYDFRKALSYNLRTPPDDYKDVYQLDKFSNGKHKYWKPFIFDLLGFDGELLLNKYDNDDEIEEIKKFISSIRNEFSINQDERDDLVGEMQSKQIISKEIEEKIDKFNFYEQDKELIKKGINEIESKISESNSLSYNLNYEIDRLNKSIKNNFAFDLKKVDKIFEESGIYFNDQIKLDYSSLLEFNNNLTTERNKLIKASLKTKLQELKTINTKLEELNNKKSELLSYIQETDLFKKFKLYQKDLVKVESELNLINEKIKKIDLIISKEEEIKSKETEIEGTVKDLRTLYQTTENNEKYKDIRLKFKSYYKSIMDEDANITWTINTNNNIDFPPPKVHDKLHENKLTAKDEGNTYKKLLCVAFDLSILSSYNNESYYRFVYHDDVLSQQDNGIKHRLLNLVESLSLTYDLQYILSVIKSDLPHDENDILQYFNEEEIILKLSDTDDSGTLFGISF
jgi:uncharacterized protein YydD (DUF2326 family)